MNSKIVLFFVALSAICFLEANGQGKDNVLSDPTPHRPVRPLIFPTEQQSKQFQENYLRQIGSKPVERVRRADGRPYLPRPTPRPNFS